jgi:hypothetical protein
MLHPLLSRKFGDITEPFENPDQSIAASERKTIMEVKETISDQVFTARIHGIRSQPPASIATFTALSRDLLLNGQRTAFYFGEEANGTRVSFRFSGIWYHITFTDNQPANLFDDLKDLSKTFRFVTRG